MKNQNDLIISIVAIVLALIIAGVCFGTKREPVKPADPEQVNLSAPTLPQGDVVMKASLPGASNSSGGAQGGPTVGKSGGGIGAGAGRPAIGATGPSAAAAGGGGKQGSAAMNAAE